MVALVVVASVYQVAAQIKQRLGSIDRFRLLKLVYYVQAWSLVYRNRPAFPERIEAWPHGPVVRHLWTDINHYNSADVAAAAPLSADDAQVVDSVLAHFGNLSGTELVDLTHAEAPWKDARVGLAAGERSTREITPEAMRTYYAATWAEAAEDNDAVLGQNVVATGGVDALRACLASSV